MHTLKADYFTVICKLSIFYQKNKWLCFYFLFFFKIMLIPLTTEVGTASESHDQNNCTAMVAVHR